MKLNELITFKVNSKVQFNLTELQTKSPQHTDNRNILDFVQARILTRSSKPAAITDWLPRLKTVNTATVCVDSSHFVWVFCLLQQLSSTISVYITWDTDSCHWNLIRVNEVMFDTPLCESCIMAQKHIPIQRPVLPWSKCNDYVKNVLVYLVAQLPSVKCCDQAVAKRIFYAEGH